MAQVTRTIYVDDITGKDIEGSSVMFQFSSSFGMVKFDLDAETISRIASCYIQQLSNMSQNQEQVIKSLRLHIGECIETK